MPAAAETPESYNKVKFIDLLLGATYQFSILLCG
jgi:hypothetical protein